jgi:hypothetical protein
LKKWVDQDPKGDEQTTDEISPLLMAFVRLLGFEDAKEVYWEAIAGTPQNVRCIRIKTFDTLLHCLSSYDYYVLHIEEPKIVISNELPYKVNKVDILIKKTDHSFEIDYISSEEEEYQQETDLPARLKKVWEVTKFGLTLFSIFSKYWPK